MTVLLRCPDCDGLTYDPRAKKCSAPCPYCGDRSEPDVTGCVDGGCDKPDCRRWANDEARGEDLRERAERY